MTEKSRKNAKPNTQTRTSSLLLNLSEGERYQLKYLAGAFGNNNENETLRLLIQAEYVRRAMGAGATLSETVPASL